MEFIFGNGVSARIHIKNSIGYADYIDVVMRAYMPHDENLIPLLKEKVVADDEIITYIEFRQEFDGEIWTMEVNK